MRKLHIVIACLLMTLLVGCGGGGSDSGGGGTQGATLFLTDNLSAGYDHVWVKIHEVEVEYSGGSTKVFESDAGESVDVRGLNKGGTNLFKFLGVAQLPTQPINKVKFTVAKQLELFATGATSSSSAQFANEFDFGTGRSRFEIVLATPLVVGPNANVTFDFDLAQWNLSSGVVTPVANLYTGGGLDDSGNHLSEDFKGTVSQLGGTAPNLSMVVTTVGGKALAVVADANTAIFNSNGSPSPVIADGKVVEVKGVYSLATRKFMASVIKIEDGAAGENENKVEGAVRAGNLANLTFEVKSEFVRGFVPKELWVKVQASVGTKFFNRNGVVIPAAEFFAALAAGEVEVEGSYNPATNVMTAVKAKLEDGTGGEGYQEAKGTATAFNDASITVSLTEWEGFAGSAGSSLVINVTGSTKYKDENGTVVSKTDFFAALANGKLVKAEGSYSNGVLVAKSLEIRSGGSGGGNGGGGGGGNDPHDVNGYVSAIDPVARTFKVTLVSWFGFTGAHGAVIDVTMNSDAIYRDDQGMTMSQAAFFESLVNGGLVEVDGLVSGSGMVGVKAKLDND